MDHPERTMIRSGCVVIAIATYRRPETLGALLRSLKAQNVDHQRHIVVADNDIDASAREVVASVCPTATYVIEPRPGISAARNAGIEQALRFKPWAIAFIDDDETADPLWLEQLIASMIKYDADVVTGPIHYELPYAPTRTTTNSHYFRKIERCDGSPVTYVATNNALVRASWFYGANRLRFDDRFGLSGGEDLELFLRLQEHGGRCVWAANALVTAQVPFERTERTWLLRRELRNGQLMARLRQQFDRYSRFWLFAIGIHKLAQGIGMALQEIIAGRRVSMPAQFKMMAGTGWLRAAFGHLYLEYGRPAPSPSKRSQAHHMIVSAKKISGQFSIERLDDE